VWRAVRHDDWKLVTRLEVGKRDEWLFDLKNDPSEKVDESKNRPQLKQRLTDLLVGWETETKPVR
jgi:arylsulfatase A-like enzyme